MGKLLEVPVELRLKIFSMAISSLPNVIHVDEGATSQDPPRSSLARALRSIDNQLSGEMIPLYWSNNVFQSYLLSGMGHYIATDSTFHRWLKHIVKDAFIWIRHLRFKGMKQVPLAHEADCFLVVDVDVKYRTVLFWTRDGHRCTCVHAEDLAVRLADKLQAIPSLEGQLCPTPSSLWDVFDCWFTYHPTHSRPQRSWEEFERQQW